MFTQDNQKDKYKIYTQLNDNLYQFLIICTKYTTDNHS
jgi:hypothetical protein